MNHSDKFSGQWSVEKKWLAAIVESSDDAIIFKDLNGIIKTWNKGAERIFGYTAEEVIGKSVLILIPDEYQHEEPGILARIRQGERINHYETVRRRKDGQLVNVSLTVSPVKDDDGEIIGASKIARDITERRHSEEIMRQQASLFDQVYDAIFVWRWNGPITFWNRGAERMYGFSRMEALGRVSHKLLNTRTSRGMDTLLSELESQGQWEGELEHITRDGCYINVETRMVLVREPAYAYVLEVNRDITARKHAEQDLEESFRREKAARELAEKANLTKDNFLAMLSHELRTPLNPVLLIASDSAQNPELPAEVRAQFETILKNVEVEARLIDDLLDLSRINHGKLKLRMQAVDAHAVLRETIQTVREQIDGKQIQIIPRLDAEKSLIFADAIRLQQIFWNILKNAVKFTPKGGRITVETFSTTERRLIVKISDTGIGMTPEEMERLFSAFSQGDHFRDESANYGGLGLGLAISKKLVELHSAHIEASSKGRGCGASFTVEFPLTTSELKSSSTTPDLKLLWAA